jgi:hypothetical protein
MANAFFVPFTLITAASEPGPIIVFDCTMWSYCCQTHCRDERFGRRNGEFQKLVPIFGFRQERIGERRLAAIEKG